MPLKSDYDNWHQSMALTETDQVMPLYPWHQTVLKLLPDLAGKNVLEVGCGRGDFARLLGQKYTATKIVATDFSHSAIEAARSKLPEIPNVSFCVADAQNLPFDDGCFDFVISCECLEHVESPLRMMLSVARCLKREGSFVITTENYFNGTILAWIKSWLSKQPFNSGSGVQPRENFFLFWRVRQIIKKAGLKVTHTESNHFTWLLLPGFAPDRFFIKDFSNPTLKRVFRPFGRHFTYCGIK